MRNSSSRRTAAAISALLSSLLLVTACVPFAQPGAEQRPELRLYTGEIPEPLPLPDRTFAEAPPMPEPPEDWNDGDAWSEYETQIEEWVEQYQQLSASGDHGAFYEAIADLVAKTRNSDADSVAAWQTLLVASGIAVGNGAPQVEINGMTGGGIPMTFPELRLHALGAAADGGIMLTELAYMLEGLEVFGGQTIFEELHDDLLNAMPTEFGVIYSQLSDDPTQPFGAVPAEQVMLNSAQAMLVVRRLSAELAQRALELQSDPSASGPSTSRVGTASASALAGGSPAAPATFTSAATARSGGGACDLDFAPWEATGIEQISKGLGYLFGKVIEKSLGPVAGAYLSAASAAMALATVMAKMMLMQADIRMSDAPLVRTKDQQPGSQRDLTMYFTLPETAHKEAAECLQYILAPLGIDTPLTESGAMAGIDVQLVLVDKSRLWLDSSSGGTDTFVKTTSANGYVEFGVVGKPQRQRLPDAAKEDDTTSYLRAEANVNNSDFAKQLRNLPWAALGGAFGVLPGILERWKIVPFAYHAPVRDWKAETDFEVTIAGTITGHTAVNRTSNPMAGCGAPRTTNESSTTMGSVESLGPERVTAHLLTGEGREYVYFLPTLEGQQMFDQELDDHDGFRQFEMGLVFNAVKQRDNPGTDPMPRHFTETKQSGCGDGMPGYEPPPEDCGPDRYSSVDWVNLNAGSLHLTHERWLSESTWKRCGFPHWPMNPVAPPPSLERCESPHVTGTVPPAHVVFDSDRPSFEIEGSMHCQRENEGSLYSVQFDWTMTFCRIVDNTSAC